MQVLTTISEMRQARAELRRSSKTLGLVPTMGALHGGHLSLVEAARAGCDAVVVSIFVNPAQFAPGEDFERYPRNLDADCELLRKAEIDYVFAPSVEEIYPSGASTYVLVEGVSERLDGGSRPGHFRGVATVVSKLFNIVNPDRAWFGQKDAAQVAVLRKMVTDLNFPLELVVCPIVRDPDGLALSSRNRYLTSEQRQRALVLRRALLRVEALAAHGISSSATLIEAAGAVLAAEPDVMLDYFAVLNPETLVDVVVVEPGNTLVAIAAHVGNTRLIDNVLL